MDKAPTRPNARAKEDLIIVITKRVVVVKRIKFPPNFLLFEREVPYLT